ncbi:MAG: DUF2384 domain-containing protein [Pseudomonadota bacterium]|nr:DUF2384 domain-containing protein [Pseudomonadota bacterium]
MPESPAAPPPETEEGSLYEQKPARRQFTRRRDQPRLAPEQAARQGRAVSFALQSFPSPAAAMAFLNTDQPGLGRPIDLAIESVAGLAAVEAALASRTSKAG